MATDPLAPAEDLRVLTTRRIVAAGEIFSFDVVFAANPAVPLDAFDLRLPGFVPIAPPAALPAGGIRLTGHLSTPGFYALAASARIKERAVAGRDYFVATAVDPNATPHEAGYYVFLGCGDYPIITGRETHALASWSLRQWIDLVAWMGAHGMNRLWVLVNGYTLAYPSQRYPTLRDPHARNVTENFLRELIDEAHRHGVQVYLMLTTDGHARNFSRLHPEAVRLGADRAPGPQFGLALEHPLTRRYLFDVLDEVLELYPNADGVAVHPTESDPERSNPETLAAYRAETGRDLQAETPKIRRGWYNRAFARFMVEFTDRCRRHRADLSVVMANCWWQDDHVAINRAELPADLRIAVWYYTWEDRSPQSWPLYRWVEAFGADRVIYVPVSQSYCYPSDPQFVMDRHIGIDRLVSTAAVLGVRNTLYFAGWDIPPEAARLLDVALVQHPSATFARDAMPKLVDRLYGDYFAARSGLVLGFAGL